MSLVKHLQSKFYFNPKEKPVEPPKCTHCVDIGMERSCADCMEIRVAYEMDYGRWNESWIEVSPEDQQKVRWKVFNHRPIKYHGWQPTDGEYKVEARFEIVAQQRKLANAFLMLPYHRRIEAITKLGISPGDYTLPDQTKNKNWFTEIKERKLEQELWINIIGEGTYAVAHLISGEQTEEQRTDIRLGTNSDIHIHKVFDIDSRFKADSGEAKE